MNRLYGKTVGEAIAARDRTVRGTGVRHAIQTRGSIELGRFVSDNRYHNESLANCLFIFVGQHDHHPWQYVFHYQSVS